MVTTITTALSGLEADLLAVAGVGLGVGVAIFALRKGYSLVKSFI
jgi:Inovirus Coat protein B